MFLFDFKYCSNYNLYFFILYNLYFFQDFIPVSSLNDDWTNVYELEEKSIPVV